MVELDLPVVGGDRGAWGGKLNGALETLAGAVNDIPATVATATSDEIDSRGLVSALDLVTELKTSGRGIMIGHRGGARIHPEHTMEGYEDCFRSGFLIETDIRQLSTGELVCVHDGTTDRTMTGASATISAMTLDDWLSRQVVSPWPGGRAAAPVLWEDVLAAFGGRVVIVAEVKDDAAATDIIDSITRRGLHRQVIVQSFTQAIAEQAAAAGVGSMFLCGTTTTAVPATLAAAGVEFLGPGKNMTQADMQLFIQEGMTVVPYTVQTAAELADVQAKGAAGAFMDDPWGVTGRYARQTRDPFASGRPWYGWDYRPSDTATDPSYIAINYATSQGKLFMDGIRPGGLTHSMLQSWALPVDVTAGKVLRVRFRAGFDRESTADLKWLGLFIGSTPNGGAFDDDTPTAGQNGYHCLARRTGRLDVYRVDGAGGATNLVNIPGSGVPAAENQFHEYEFEVVLTTSNVTITRLGNGDSAQAADATYRSNLGLHLTVQGMLGTFADMSYQLLDASTLEL